MGGHSPPGARASGQWPRLLTILVAFLSTLLATALAAWWTSRPPPSLLSPGDAALYRITDDSGQTGLYGVHVARPGPFPYAPTAGSLIRLQETYLGSPVENTTRRRTIFYLQEGNALYIAGIAGADGGHTFTPPIPAWLPDLTPTLPPYTTQAVWRWVSGPLVLRRDLRSTLRRRPEERIITPRGVFSQTFRLDQQAQTDSLVTRQRIWYAKQAPLLPLIQELSTAPGGAQRYELLSASWLSPSPDIPSPADEVGASGDIFLDRGGPERQGAPVVPTTTAIAAQPLALHWLFVAADDLTSPPLWAGDLLVFGDEEGVLRALDPVRGEVRWTFTAGQAIIAAPAVANGIVYVASGSRLYALEARTGLYLWSVTVGDVIHTSPLVAGDLLPFGAEDGYLYGLDARRGTLRWRFPAGAPIIGAAAAAQDAVYFGTREGAFYALRTADGETLWQVNLEGTVLAPPSLFGQTIYVGLSGGLTGGRVVALNRADGSPLWTSSVPGDVINALAVDEEAVYVSTFIGTALALDRRTGSPRWQKRLIGQKFNAPLVIGEMLVLTDTGGGVHVLDKKTGQTMQVRQDLGPFGASAAYGKGFLFLVDRDRRAYALRLSRGPRERNLRLTLLWDRLLMDPRTGGRPHAGPTIWADRPLLLLDNGDLRLFDPDGGQDTWLTQLGGYTPYTPHIISDMAYIARVGTEDAETAVIAFDLANRRIRWQAVLGEVQNISLDAAEGRVLVSVSTPQGGRVLALDEGNGARLWEAAIPADPGAPLAANGSVYLAAGRVFAWDAKTGRLRWRSPEFGAGGMLAMCGNTLYVGAVHAQGPTLVALDPSTGRIRWWGSDRVAFPFGRAACDPKGGQVLVGGLDGRIHAYDATTGEPRWTHQTGEPFLSSLVVANGVVYGATGEGTLIGVRVEDGRLLARYTLPYADIIQATPLLATGRIYLNDSTFLYALEAVEEPSH